MEPSTGNGWLQAKTSCASIGNTTDTISYGTLTRKPTQALISDRVEIQTAANRLGIWALDGLETEAGDDLIALHAGAGAQKNTGQGLGSAG